MPEYVQVTTSDSEIDAALRRARAYAKYDRKLVKATYLESSDRLRLVLDDGAACSIPRKLIQGLAGVRKNEKLRQIQVINLGRGLLWPLLDVAHSVPALLTGVYGSSRWMKELELKSKPVEKSKKKPTSAGIDSRHRDLDGNIREKSGNTQVDTLRKIYGDDFLSDWRSDAKLSSVRQETDMSLNEMVRQYRIGKRLPTPKVKSNGLDTKIKESQGGSMANGLDDRHRDKDGRISEKHGNTEVGTLREEYGQDFLSEWRSDAHLETVREATGKSLSQLVKEHQNK